MTKRKDPAMLANFRFLPEHLQAKVRNFVNLLDEPYREFAVLRYLDNKNFSSVAEKMGYSERSLYNIRDSVIDMWDFYISKNKNHDNYERVKNRIIELVTRQGPVSHYILSSNMSKYGFNRKELREIINSLVELGYITCQVRRNTRGQPTKIYIKSII